MKNYFLLFITLFFSLKAFTFPILGGGTDSLTKGRLCSRHPNSKKQVVVSGPFTVDPKTIKTREDNQHRFYHNEQDNFKRPDSLPYHPAPKMDTAGSHSFNGLHDNGEDLMREDRGASRSTIPSVSFGFDAESCRNNDPPDNAMAISDSGYIVSAVNCGMVIYNLSGQPIGNPISYQSFFNATTANFSDPRLIYDVYSDRFIFFIQYGNNSSNSAIYIAFSTTHDPSQPWTYYSFPIGTSAGLEPGYWFDYPSIAINQTDLCITGNIFTDSGAFASNVLILLNKQDGYSGVALHWLHWNNVLDANSNTGFTIVPASAGQNVVYSNGFYLVSTVQAGGSYITEYTLNGSATDTTSLCCTVSNIATQPYTPSATATEPNGINLANNKAGCRTQGAIYLDGKVMFVFAADYNNGSYDYNSIYYNKLDISTSVLSQNWSYLGGSNYNYPSIASFGLNQTDLAVILSFLKADTATNPEIRFKYFDANMNQLASTQVRAGDAYVDYTWAPANQQRWGDYSATQRRFGASQPEVWLSGSYGNSTNYWQTHIAQITGYPGIVTAATEVILNGLTDYPNPVKSQLYVKGDFSDFYGFPELYSLDGKLLPIDVTRKGNDMFQVDATSLAKGEYVLKFRNRPSVKFIKE